MRRLAVKTVGAILALALLWSAVPAGAAPAVLPLPVPAQTATLEARLKALEERLAVLERAMALSSIDVVGLVTSAAPAVVSLYLVDTKDRVQSQGTGFIVDKEGFVLTNAHVVEAGYSIKVKFASGEVTTADRLLVDPFLDLAVLRIQGTDHPTLSFAAAKPAVGEPLVVIGNAYGYSNTVTMGIVSGVDRPDPYHYHHYPSLQTDAAINHGNSGGPILNARGEVVAMATWTELKNRTDSIAFGIPVDQIQKALDRFTGGRGIVRPWLGASVREPYWARGGLPNDVGLLVSGAHIQGAGSLGGLRSGDWITQVNGTPVNYLMELRAELERYKPGDTIVLTVERDHPSGEGWVEQPLKLKLGEFSGAVPMLVPGEYDEETDDLF